MSAARYRRPVEFSYKVQYAASEVFLLVNLLAQTSIRVQSQNVQITPGQDNENFVVENMGLNICQPDMEVSSGTTTTFVWKLKQSGSGSQPVSVKADVQLSLCVDAKVLQIRFPVVIERPQSTFRCSLSTDAQTLVLGQPASFRLKITPLEDRPDDAGCLEYEVLADPRRWMVIGKVMSLCDVCALIWV